MATLSNDPAGYRVEYHGGLARVDWDVGDAGSLTSITAIRRNVNYANRDPDAIPLSVYYLRAETNDKQFTQELRFASPAEMRFSYVAGFFYLRQRFSPRSSTATMPANSRPWQGRSASRPAAFLASRSVW